MKDINYTWPGRFHLIWDEEMFYITAWFFKWRFHRGPELPLWDWKVRAK